MLLTPRTASPAGSSTGPTWTWSRTVTAPSWASGGGARPPPALCDRARAPSVGQAPGVDLLVVGVFRRRVLHHRGDHLVVGLVPVRRDVPVLAVPCLHAAGAGALVVGARHLNGLEHALEAELLDAVGGEVEIFRAPPHLLAGERLLAEPILGRADGFDAEHAVDQAAHVEDLAGLLPFGHALVLVVEELLEILMQLELPGGVLQRDGVVALGTVLGRADI